MEDILGNFDNKNKLETILDKDNKNPIKKEIEKLKIFLNYFENVHKIKLQKILVNIIKIIGPEPE